LAIATFVVEKVEEVIEREVGNGGGSGRIYVPKEWVGRTVKIVLLSESNRKEKNGKGGESGTL